MIFDVRWLVRSVSRDLRRSRCSICHRCAAPSDANARNVEQGKERASCSLSAMAGQALRLVCFVSQGGGRNLGSMS